MCAVTAFKTVKSFGAVCNPFNNNCFSKFKSRTMVERVLRILAQLINIRGSVGSILTTFLNFKNKKRLN